MISKHLVSLSFQIYGQGASCIFQGLTFGLTSLVVDCRWHKGMEALLIWRRFRCGFQVKISEKDIASGRPLQLLFAFIVGIREARWELGRRQATKSERVRIESGHARSKTRHPTTRLFDLSPDFACGKEIRGDVEVNQSVDDVVLQALRVVPGTDFGRSEW